MLLIIFQDCNTNNPNIERNLVLSLDDVSCTEAWLGLKLNNINGNDKISLKVNDVLWKSVQINSTDTVLYIDSLNAERVYSFSAVELTNGEETAKSESIMAKTMDTTSNEYSWKTFTLGDGNSSYLNDVAIINDSDIWAVGSVYMKDSTGKFEATPHNAVHWNGEKWIPLKLYYNYNGQNFVGDLYAVYAFNANDIWFGAGSMIHWDGSKYQSISNASVFPSTMRKIFGFSDSSFVIVGLNGAIAFYNRQSWEKIPSNTSLPIQDIWGENNSGFGSNEILCVASDKYYNQGKELIQISNNGVSTIPTNGLPWSLSSIWFISNRKYYIAGDGVYIANSLSGNWKQIPGFPSYYSDAIRGTGFNNIVTCGSNGTLSHYNGIRWRHYLNKELPSFSGHLVSAAINDNMIIAVGYKGEKAIIVMGQNK